MKFINLTSHTINEVTTGQEFPTTGRVARTKTFTDEVDNIEGCPIYTTETGELYGLPQRVEGVTYIVSALALNAVPSDRTDVVAPGNLQRDEHGKPIGCMGFRRKV